MISVQELFFVPCLHPLSYGWIVSHHCSWFKRTQSSNWFPECKLYRCQKCISPDHHFNLTAPRSCLGLFGWNSRLRGENRAKQISFLEQTSHLFTTCNSAVERNARVGPIHVFMRKSLQGFTKSNNPRVLRNEFGLITNSSCLDFFTLPKDCEA